MNPRLFNLLLNEMRSHRGHADRLERLVLSAARPRPPLPRGGPLPPRPVNRPGGH
ncbi:MAG: hypothetical protein QOJ19_1812 [Acidimicrobiia bacterium]|jgi:hypothetical protein|nr:hypothetical protein [Acidimicrobiia bacterium]